jgi:hypothetical protein
MSSHADADNRSERSTTSIRPVDPQMKILSETNQVMLVPNFVFTAGPTGTVRSSVFTVAYLTRDRYLSRVSSDFHSWTILAAMRVFFRSSSQTGSFSSSLVLYCQCQWHAISSDATSAVRLVI